MKFEEDGGGHKVPIAFHLDMELDQLTYWVERMPQAVMLVDGRGGVAAVNRRLLNALRFERDEILGQPCTRFVALSKDVESYIVRTDDFGDPMQSVQGSLLVKGSPPHPAAIQLISGKSRGGWYHLLLLIPAPKKMSLLQQFADLLITDLQLGIVLMDNRDRVTEINPAACRLLGLERTETLGLPVAGLFCRVSPVASRDSLQDKLAGEPVFQNLSTAWEIDGRHVEVVVDYRQLIDFSGGKAGAYLVIRDVTQLHTLEMQLRQTDRLTMIGQIAAGTAHEIRNPLTSIKGFLQVMKHALKEKGELKEQGYTEIMLREIDRINDLVSEFLLLSKPRSARMYPVQVAEVLQELLPLIENEAILHNTEVRCELQEDPFPRVLADGEQLKQVFLNLCKNGIEAMGDGGTLTIRLKLLEREEMMAVEVVDAGPGIPSYATDKIFDPFFTTKENGTGLGLSVCQRIVHDIGGNIHVSSNDWGTTFSVLLPCLEE